MKARITAIITGASVLVICGSIAFAWRSAPSEEVLPCDGEEHDDIESKEGEWREFETFHGSGSATRSEERVIADLVMDRAEGYTCEKCPSDGVACEKEAGSDYT